MGDNGLAAAGLAGPDELRPLEMARHRFNIDRLHAAIERGTRARLMTDWRGHRGGPDDLDPLDFPRGASAGGATTPMPISASRVLLTALILICAAIVAGCGSGVRAVSDPAGFVSDVDSEIVDPIEIATISTRLSTGDSVARAEAARTLRRARPFSIVESDLIAALSDPEPDVRLAAVETLTRPVRSAAVAEPLLAAINDPDPRVGSAAALAVRDFRPEASAALATVIDRIKTGDDRDRRLAAEQLQFLWTALDDESFLTVVGLLDDPEPRLRQISALTVNKALVVRRNVGINPRTDVLVGALTPALSDSDADVRRDAARALEQLGSAAAASWPAIEAGLRAEVDREASLAMEMAARSVDPAGRGGLSRVGTTVWTDVGLCLARRDVEIAGLSPRDPEAALAGIGRDPVRLSAWENWRASGPYAVIRHHYATFGVDVADGEVERVTSTDPMEEMPNGLRAGLARDMVFEVLGINPTARARGAGLLKINLCDAEAAGVAVEMEFNAFDVLSELSVTTNRL